MIDRESLDHLYQSYDTWKNWSDETTVQADRLKKELKRAGIAPGAALLEIGFGSGGFLDWAREEGYRVRGIEQVESLIFSAQAKGHDVYHDDDTFSAIEPNSIDAVIAFDVLEHMDVKGLFSFFAKAKNVLISGGRIIVRVPNCASPYGFVYQFGDLTHLTPLSENSFRQLAISSGFSVQGVYPAAETLTGPGGPLLRSAVFLLRDLHSVIVSYLYFGKRHIMTPAITAVLLNADPN